MGKKIGIGGLISPASLWGKPLPNAAPTPKTTKEEKVTGKMTDDDDIMEDADIDVDAELADADVDDEELHAVEAEVGADVSDAADNSEPDEKESADEEPDYDAEDGDIEAESESVVEEEVVTAVADDEEQEEVETKKVSATRGKRSMADTKVSLSDHIRNEISKREASGASLRGKDIVEALAKRKIAVSPAQVSQLLKKAGLGGKTRSRKPAAAVTADAAPSRVAARKPHRREVETATAPRVAPKARPTGNGGFKVPMAQLQAAESFVEACGGSFKNAERILTAASQLSQTFGG
jgi:hypothetical protein